MGTLTLGPRAWDGLCGRYEHVRSRACIAHFTASFELQDQERIVSVLESRVRRQFWARDWGQTEEGSGE